MWWLGESLGLCEVPSHWQTSHWQPSHWRADDWHGRRKWSWQWNQDCSTLCQEVGNSNSEHASPEDWSEYPLHGSQEKLSPKHRGAFANHVPVLVLCSNHTVQSLGEGASIEVQLTGRCIGPSIRLSTTQFPRRQSASWAGHSLKGLGSVVHAHINCNGEVPCVEVYHPDGIFQHRLSNNIISVKLGIYMSEADLVQVVIDGNALWTSSTSHRQSFVHIIRPKGAAYPPKLIKVTLNAGEVHRYAPILPWICAFRLLPDVHRNTNYE